MLVMSKGALSAGQAETYYEEKYSQDDYYTEEHRVVGRWFGKGANALGLSGEIATEDFRAVLRGQRPDTAEVLVRQRATDERTACRMGRDLQRTQVSQHSGAGGRRRRADRRASPCRQPRAHGAGALRACRVSTAAANGC